MRGKLAFLIIILLFLLVITVNAGSLPSIYNFNNIEPSVTFIPNGTSEFIGKNHQIAVGDINNDNFNDIAFSSTDLDFGGLTAPGIIYIYYGRTTWPSTISIATSSPNVTIKGNETNDKLGSALAIGDVNGDNFDDIIAGSLNKTNIFFGASNLPLNIDLLTVSPNVTIRGNESGGTFGMSRIKLGDFNNDGIKDILAGSSSADPGGIPNAGEVYMFYGRTTWPRIINHSELSANFTFKGNSSSDIIPRDLAVGDVNGDNIDDMLIGCDQCSPGGRIDTGTIFVMYGKPNFGGVVKLREGDTANLTIKGNSSNDEIGIGIGAIDIDNDGDDDIIIGNTGGDPAGIPSAGMVHIVLGGSALTGTIDFVELNDNITIKGNETLTKYGQKIATGNFNNDNFGDFIAGSINTSVFADLISGKLHLTYGATGLKSYNFSESISNVTFFGNYSSSGNSKTFGQEVLASDINNDGLADIIIGDPSFKITPFKTGTIYIILGSVAGRCSEGQFCACGDLITGSKTLTTSDSVTNTNCTASALTINASNIVLDGGGLGINGTGNGTGILNSGGFDNVVIKNFQAIKNFTSGINMSGTVNGITLINNTIIGANTTNGYGIHLITGSATNISNNNITTFGTTSHAIVLVESSINNITFNNINTTSTTNGRGINLITISNLNNISNNNITTNLHGIVTNGHNTTISKNNITILDGGSGIVCGFNCNDSVFFNNIINTSQTNAHGIDINISARVRVLRNNITTTGSNGYGLYILGSNNSIINLNNIHTIGGGSQGLLIQNSINNNFSSNNVTTSEGGSAYGVYLDSGTKNNFTNDLITSTGTTNFQINKGNATLTNVTFDKSKIGFDVGSTGGINIKSFLFITVNRFSGGIVSGVRVNIFNSSDVVEANFTTDTNGYNKTLLIDRFQNRTLNVTATPHNITLTAPTILNRSRVINLTNVNISTQTIKVFTALNTSFTGNAGSVNSTNINNLNNLSTVQNLRLTNTSPSNKLSTEILFLKQLNASTVDLKKHVSVGQNFVSINVSLIEMSGLNSSANITINISTCTGINPFFKSGFSQSAADIVANGTQCTGSTSPACNAITCTGDKLTFNVTGFSGFAASNAPAAASGSNETSSITVDSTTNGAGSNPSVTAANVQAKTGIPPAPKSPGITPTGVSISKTTKDIRQLFMSAGTPVANLALIAGDYARPETVQSLLNIALALQESASITYTRPTEEIIFSNPLQSLSLNQTIAAVKNSVYDEDLNIFESGDIFTNSKTSYTQQIEFNSSSNSIKAVFDLNENEEPGDYFIINQGDEILKYNLIFDEGLNSKLTNKTSTKTNLPDIINTKTVYVLGTPFKITNASLDATQAGEVKITLMNGELEAILEENKPKTYSLSSGIYTINAQVITNKDVLFEVNDKPLPRLKNGDYYQMQGLNISVRDVITTNDVDIPNIVRFFLNGKTIELYDSNYGDELTKDSSVKINGEIIYDAEVSISATVVSDRASINKIVYTLNGRSPQGNIYLKPGDHLSDHLVQRAGLLSDNFDLVFDGLTSPGNTPVSFVPEGDKQYYIEFVNFEGLKYRVPFVNTQRDGTLRFGKFSGDQDNNLIFIEGNSSNNSVIFNNDYFIVSDILTDTVTTSGNAARFNNGSQKDTFGYTHVFQYKNFDNSNNILSFIDLGEGLNTSTVSVSVDNNGNGTLKAGGQHYQVKVNITNGGLNVDLNGDGFFNNKLSVIALQGGGLLALGNKNPVKNNSNTLLPSIGASINVSLATIIKTGNGSDNTHKIFPFISRNNLVSINTSAITGISFKHLNAETDVARDTFGTYYNLFNSTGDMPPTLSFDYPLSQVNVVFKAKGAELDEKEEFIGKFNALPPNTLKLASEITDITLLNTVLMGTPCDNFLIDRLFNFPKPCDSGLPDFGSVVKLFKFNNNSVSLVFAGKTPLMIEKTVNDIVNGKLQFNFANSTKINISNSYLNASVEIINVELDDIPLERLIQECYPIRDLLLDSNLVEWSGPTNKEIAVLTDTNSFLFLKNKLSTPIKVRELNYLNGFFNNEVKTDLNTDEGFILRNSNNIRKEVTLIC